jgi:hypothetical protein
MTETRRPPACHFDRALGMRVITKHRDDCPSRLTDDGECPADARGCAPCTAAHCLICSREHATNDRPDTCAECIGHVREDLTQLAADYQALAVEAIAGGGDGRLVAAAPIPGGNAAVLHGPMVRLDQLRTGRGYTTEDMAEIHHRKDPVPPLAVLAQWEDMWRAWFGHARGGRATVAGAVRYLCEQLDHMANGQGGKGPDWLAFTKQVRTLRAGLERALHDEQEPERGVECFECGDRLVRRFRDPKRCRHSTPARVELQRALVRQLGGQDWLRIVGSYPEVHVMEGDLAAARGPSAALVAAARRPCAKCVERQGGLDDPRAGRSWECPGCRKQYDVGEYVTAVRRDLIEGEGWTHAGAAAAAATDVVGMVVTDTLVRKWAERLQVRSVCAWSLDPKTGLGRRSPQRLVFWPDVAEKANEVHQRMLEAQRRRVQNEAWHKAVRKGENPERAAERLGIGRHRLRHLIESLSAA